MRTITLLALGACAFAAAAPLIAMPVSEFLPRAERLKAKGPAAMFSSDLKPIMSEMKRVVGQYKVDLAQDRAAGRPPRSCPPKGKYSVKPDEFLSALRAIPANQRGIDMVEAFHRYMAAKHPC